MSRPELPDVVGFELDEAEARLDGPAEVRMTEAPSVRGEPTDLVRVIAVRRTPDGVALICAREVHDRPAGEAE